MNTKKNTNALPKVSWKHLIFLQGIVMIYTTSGIFAKLASNQTFLSLEFIVLYGMEIVVLGIYAILWQQIIKHIDLSVAYANRSIAIIWSMLWASILFHEQITPQNIIGVLVVVLGTMIVNSDNG